MSAVVAAAIGGAIGAIAMGVLAASAWEKDDGQWPR